MVGRGRHPRRPTTFALNGSGNTNANGILCQPFRKHYIVKFFFWGGDHTFSLLNDIKMMACEFDLKNVKATFLLYQCCK